MQTILTALRNYKSKGRNQLREHQRVYIFRHALIDAEEMKFSVTEVKLISDDKDTDEHTVDIEWPDGQFLSMRILDIQRECFVLAEVLRVIQRDTDMYYEELRQRCLQDVEGKIDESDEAEYRLHRSRGWKASAI